MATDTPQFEGSGVVPQVLRCPNGHHWDSAAGQVCPVCEAQRAVDPADAFGTVADPTPSANWPEVPHHEVQGFLGRGGMGVVYKARQIKLNRIVAVKILSPDAEPEAVVRFQTEAEVDGRLHHPNIVQIFEVGETGGRSYLCLEFVGGGSLEQRLRGGVQPVGEAVEMIETLARAMHHAHERDVIHRDLKPSNILLGTDGTPKISDFGLAKLVKGNARQTRAGDVVGTPYYMSPEQASGLAYRVGPETDVYAFGAILYEMLAGRPPFRAVGVLETLELVRRQEPVCPRRFNAQIHPDLSNIILKCLEKEPERRYRTALELADDLRRFQRGEPVHARPIPRWQRGYRWLRRRPAVVSVAALLLMTITLSGALWASFRTRPDRQAISREAEHLKEERKELEEEAAAVEASRVLELQVPAGLPSLGIPSDNPLTRAKIALGRQLFFDKRLSLDDSVSCASCHDPAQGWSNGARFATGFSGGLSTRSAPSLVNAAFQRTFFWDGRAASLEAQALAPIQNPIELGMSSLTALEEKLKAIPEYRDQFERVFESDVKAALVAKAIAAFERTLLAGDAPYDRYERGDAAALSESAVRGWNLFFNKAHCSACHNGPTFSDEAYHNIGVGMDHASFDPGRALVSKLEGDRGAFKTPTLRNVARTAPYMHDGRLATLEDVVRYYAQGGTPNAYLDEEIYPRDLTEAEIADLVAFLKEGLSSPHFPDGRP